MRGKEKRRVNCWVQYQICKIVIFGMRYGNVIAVPIRLHAWTTEKYHIAFRRRTLVNRSKEHEWVVIIGNLFDLTSIEVTLLNATNAHEKNSTKFIPCMEKRPRMNANYFIWVLVIKKWASIEVAMSLYIFLCW